MTGANWTQPPEPSWILPLDEAACWARLATGSEGRLKVQTGAGKRSVVTRYRSSTAGTEMGVVLAIPSYSLILGYSHGRRITLEVDGQDDDGGLWVVRVTGLARLVAGGTDPADPTVQPLRSVYLPADHIGGSVRHPYGRPLASQRMVQVGGAEHD